MPELPEAETIVRGLRLYIEGRLIASAAFFARRVSPDAAELLAGQRIVAVRRYGKQVLLSLESGDSLLIKLGMTGALLWNGERGPYTRARLDFEGGGTLLFDDIRQFGSLRLVREPPRGLGPDPFEITAEDFGARLRSRDTEVKRALLDQSLVRGLGNIYTDEALFRAGIHPRARTRRLSLARAQRLHAEIIGLLEEAIELGGSSISDYVDAEGRRGTFQTRHQVYGKAGQPCPRCGGRIERIVVAQRGTHFCPRCQRK